MIPLAVELETRRTRPESFLHMERRKRDLTLSLSFSLFLIRGNIFREAAQQQTKPHRGGQKGGRERGRKGK